jgi:CRISPR-associated protein Cas2
MEHLYILSYDIHDRKRWRRVFRIARGFGEWLQLSVFQCRLDRMRLLQLEADLSQAILHREDHVLIIDLGPAEKIKPSIRSIGKAFQPLEREPVIV